MNSLAYKYHNDKTSKNHYMIKHLILFQLEK